MLWSTSPSHPAFLIKTIFILRQPLSRAFGSSLFHIHTATPDKMATHVPTRNGTSRIWTVWVAAGTTLCFEGELRWKLWPLPEYEHVFMGTCLALDRPLRRRSSLPGASPARDTLLQRVGITHWALAAHSLVCPFLEICLPHTPPPILAWWKLVCCFRQGEATISGSEFFPRYSYSPFNSFNDRCSPSTNTKYLL